MFVRAWAVVDCSGDADVAYFAGAETINEEGARSPMTLCFNVTNIDMDEAMQLLRDKARRQAFAEQRAASIGLSLPRGASGASRPAIVSTLATQGRVLSARAIGPILRN